MAHLPQKGTFLDAAVTESPEEAQAIRAEASRAKEGQVYGYCRLYRHTHVYPKP